MSIATDRERDREKVREVTDICVCIVITQNCSLGPVLVILTLSMYISYLNQIS